MKKWKLKCGHYYTVITEVYTYVLLCIQVTVAYWGGGEGVQGPPPPSP